MATQDFADALSHLPPPLPQTPVASLVAQRELAAPLGVQRAPSAPLILQEVMIPKALESVDESVSDDRLGTLGGSPSVRPWRRLFGRLFDCYMFALFFFFFLGLMFPRMFAENDKTFDQLLGLISLIAFIPFEAFCLWAFGTTPGKALYGTVVQKLGEARPEYSSAIRRAGSVYLNGWGLGIPIVSLFTLFSSYRSLKKEGAASWDKQLGWSVIHNHLSPLRWLLILGVWAFTAFVFVIINAT
ncbi:RDD family protein [Alsobacter metallidurans]|nr:RDD family protein [Alsobacter metallidurans]